jgi:hypothetical protein
MALGLVAQYRRVDFQNEAERYFETHSALDSWAERLIAKDLQAIGLSTTPHFFYGCGVHGFEAHRSDAAFGSLSKDHLILAFVRREIDRTVSAAGDLKADKIDQILRRALDVRCRERDMAHLTNDVHSTFLLLGWSLSDAGWSFGFVNHGVGQHSDLRDLDLADIACFHLELRLLREADARGRAHDDHVARSRDMVSDTSAMVSATSKIMSEVLAS